MSSQLICDDCGEVIDQSQPYWQVQGSKVQLVEGVLTVVEGQTSFDYHDGHLPREQLEASKSPLEPMFTEDISAMTIQQALAWADDDPAKLQYALDQEVAGQNRASLVSQLENKLNSLAP